MVTHQKPLIEVTLNGEKTPVPAGLCISSLLEHLSIAPAEVAVELDQRIVRRSDWPTSPVNEGAKIEIVRFVGGG